ncbi:MAG: glycosyltransferase [Deltaproteobacteria bacterium]|nr:glycosyltransferase [Deltaproteobacteria bacterium]
MLTVSIVINTIDRVHSLANLLESLEEQTYPLFEVIVVVGPTNDRTLAMLASYRNRVIVRDCPEANLGMSRNIGIGEARGDLVAFIDDDAVPSRRWLEQIVRIFERTDLQGTGGSVFLIHPADPRLQYRFGIISPLAEQIEVQSSPMAQLVTPGLSSCWVGRMMGTNMVFTRKALWEIGGFDEFYQWVYDDADTALRMNRAGHIVAPAKEALVYHIPASSRNRKAFTFRGRWWIQTKAGIYFNLKNGREYREAPSFIFWSCLKFLSRHLRGDFRILRAKSINWREFSGLVTGEFYGALSGLLHGLFSPRRLLFEKGSVPYAARPPEDLRPFPAGAAPPRTALDPITGHRSSIQVKAPPLRICLLSSAYPPERIEGVGRHTNLLARGLFELGHTVHVITRGAREQTSFYDGAYVHKLPVSYQRYDRLRGLNNLYANLNYSHNVHDKVESLVLNEGVQVLDSPLWQIDGLVTALRGKLPLVVRMQTAIKQISGLQKDKRDDFRLLGELEGVLAERANYLIANSIASREAIETVYRLDFSRVPCTTIPIGIVPVPDELVSPYPLKPEKDHFTILFLGRLEKRKGILDLFQAIPAVLKHFPRTSFIIAGADNSDNDRFKIKTGLTYSAYFQNHFKKEAERVRFLGYVSEEAAQDLYKKCDLFVAPSLYESFGLIYLEAMNYGKPVIGCRAGGVPEVIDHGKSGILVDPGVPKELAEAILSLLQSPLSLREMGLAGREKLIREFHYLTMAKGFEAVYKEILSTRGKGF